MFLSLLSSRVDFSHKLVPFFKQFALNRHLSPNSGVFFFNSKCVSYYLVGHTIVGDGTTAQLCAMLTGKNEEELPEARRGYKDSQTVDRWPFIFKDFKRKGYVTMFQEDATYLGTFNYRLHGFKNKPTDHFTRPFYLAFNEEVPNNADKCNGNLPAHRNVLSYTANFFDAYINVKKFSYSIMARLSHNSLDSVQLVDADLANFMTDLQRKGHLNNTMFIVVGDHGLRSSSFRSTLAGKLEERFPFMSVTLPGWFKAKHKDLYNYMRENAEILTSHFDIYGTLTHMLTYPNFTRVGVGRSLFTPIDPNTRNCKDAGVADHWCPCLGYVNISVADVKVQRVSKAAVAFLNRIITDNKVAREKCAPLALKEIIRAGKVIHNWKMENFLQTQKAQHCDSCVPYYNKNQAVPFVKLELVLKVSPSDGEYELNAKVKGDEIEVDPNISRINRYGNQPECIAARYPHLRKYCFCKIKG